jgi:hypothetical protein
MSNRYKGGVISATGPTVSATVASGIWTNQSVVQLTGAGTWPRVPGAPTIGTATAGNATASVAFTAPSDTGSAAITSYTVTSTPGSFSNTGAASPITVTGLTNNTAYTFVALATNGAGTGPASAASNSVTPVAPPAWVARYYGADLPARGVYVDSSSNITTAGRSSLSIYSNAGSLTAQRFLTGFYAYTPGNANSGNKVSRDSSGNIYMLGNSSDGAPNQWGPAKLNSSYAFQWFIMTRGTPSQNNGYPATITVDSSGSNVYTSGTLGRNVCCVSLQFPAIIKYNSSGTMQWTTTFTANNNSDNSVYGHALDSSNNPVVAGTIDAASGINKLVAYVA